MLTKTIVVLTTVITSMVMASSISPRRYNILNRLSNKGIDVDAIGCKCIMTAPTRQNTDSTMCMCFNRSDGTINDTSKCRSYTGKKPYINDGSLETQSCILDTVFGFCTDVTDDTKLWQKCVKHYCPCTDSNMTTPPENKLYF